MAKEAYESKNFHRASLVLIKEIEAICSDFFADGYDLTVRQVYYQLVTKNLVSRDMKGYKKVAQLCNDARLAGLLDWKYIVDRTRNLKGTGHWSDPSDIMNSVQSSYRIDKWARQDSYIEIWIEKDALAGVIERVSNELDLNFFACRGFVSQSEMRDAALRFEKQYRRGKTCYIIHLGDHDPSGLFMTKDIDERLKMFGAVVNVNRVALSKAQVDEFQLPPNPANDVDTRFAEYQREYGDESWELDALSPRTLHGLITEAVVALRDDDTWNEDVERETQERAVLRLLYDKWDDVQEKIEEQFSSELDQIRRDYGIETDEEPEDADPDVVNYEAEEDEE